MKKENKLLLYALLSVVIPVLIFGKFYGIWSYLSLLPILCMLTFLVKNQFKNKVLKTFVVPFYMAFFLLVYQIGVYTPVYEKTLKYTISIFGAKFGFNNLAYFIITFLFFYFSNSYIEIAEENSNKSFNYDPKLINRNSRINQIINKY